MNLGFQSVLLGSLLLEMYTTGARKAPNSRVYEWGVEIVVNRKIVCKLENGRSNNFPIILFEKGKT